MARKRKTAVPKAPDLLKTLADGRITGFVSRELFKALVDARASISDDEHEQYDADTLSEMFQYQFNVNVRSVAESRDGEKQAKTKKLLEIFAKHEFPDYNKILDVDASARHGQTVIRSVNKALSEIRQLPALENEEPFDPNPWPDYNQLLDVNNAAKRAAADIRSVKDILSGIAKAPKVKDDAVSSEPRVSAGMLRENAAMEDLSTMLDHLTKVDLLKDERPTKPSPASNKDRRQSDGPHPV